jgi:hypothetical protein
LHIFLHNIKICLKLSAKFPSEHLRSLYSVTNPADGFEASFEPQCIKLCKWRRDLCLFMLSSFILLSFNAFFNLVDGGGIINSAKYSEFWEGVELGSVCFPTEIHALTQKAWLVFGHNPKHFQIVFPKCC